MVKSFFLSSRIKQVAKGAFFYFIVISITVSVVAPFFWMVLSSFKYEIDIYSIPPVWFFQPTLSNYIYVLSKSPFLLYMLNSFIVASGSTGIGLLLGLPAAYSIAKYKKQGWAMAILASRIMPGVAYLLPFYLMFLRLGMLGTHRALILAHLAITFPMIVWIMIGFFEDIPSDLVGAALIDGCSKIGAFIRVILPLTKPAIITSSIISFIFSWNDFKLALIISKPQTRTLPLAAYRTVHDASVEWGPMMATVTMIVLPVIIMVFFLQKHIVKGLTMGGIKG